MKIRSEIREQWTQFLQGQLSAAEQEALGRSLDDCPELAEVLAEDARLHQGLIEHFAARPGFLKLFEGTAALSGNPGDEEQFRQRCLSAVAWMWDGGDVGRTAKESAPAANGGGVVPEPPHFEVAPEITFMECGVAPPIVVEPPPVCRELEMANRSVGRRFHTRWRVATALGGLLGLAGLIGAWSLPGGSVGLSGRGAADQAKWAQNAGVGPADNMAISREPSADALADRTKAGARLEAEPPMAADGHVPNPLPHPLAGPARDPVDRAVAGEPVDAHLQPPQRLPSPPQEAVVAHAQDAAEAEVPNFIKDVGPLPTEPLVSKIPVGRLISSPDARWRAPPDGWSPGKTPILLEEGVAQVHFDCGLILSVQGPASFRIAAPSQVELIDGLYQAETAPAGEPGAWTLTTPAIHCASDGRARLVVNTSRDFGTGIEVRDGQVRVSPAWDSQRPVTLDATEFNRGRFLATTQPRGDYPNAAAWANDAGDFVGRITAFDTGLALSAPRVFAETMQTVARRLREAPDGMVGDWRRVVNALERLQANPQPIPPLEHPVKESGDLLPAFPDLQRELAKGLPSAKGALPLLVPGNGGMVGQINVNGQNVDLENLEDLAAIRRELAEELNQVRARRPGPQRRRGRLPPTAPDFALEQMLTAQLRQLEMIDQILSKFQDNPLILGLPEPMGPGATLTLDPVVASFAALTSDEGKRERDAAVLSFETAVRTGLETAEQRERRLQEIRDKLHQ
jgi:hypothetical protein